jgi:ferredoxin
MTDAEVRQWPLTIGCNGVACGSCSTIIITKPPVRKRLPLDVGVLSAAVEKHAPECKAIVNVRIARSL